MRPMARLISLGILTSLIVLLGITFYHVVAPFLLPLFLAGITAVLCRPVYLWFIPRTNGRPRLAAGLTTMAVLLAVLLPLVLGTVFGAVELVQLGRSTIGNEEWRQRMLSLKSQPWVLDLAEQAEAFLQTDPNFPTDFGDGPAAPTWESVPSVGSTSKRPSVQVVRENTPLSDEVRADRLRTRIDSSLRAALQYVGGRTVGFVGSVPGVALGVLGQAVGLLVAIVIFGIALYYFLCDGPALLVAAEALVPVKRDYQQQLLIRFDTVVRAVVLSTFLAALVQGVLTTGALALCGFDHLVVLLVLSSLTAMIPMAGTWLVWGPAAVYLAMNGHWIIAGLLTLFGTAVVGTVDNVIRTYVLNNDAKLHPLLAFVSVLGGLRVMGLWGVFIGPIVAACLHALMQIFNHELKAFSQERGAGHTRIDTEPELAAPVPVAQEPVAAPPTSEVITPPPALSARKRRRR